MGAPGVFLGHTSPAYANMVGPFGGITAATLLRAVLQHPERLGDPLSLTVNFAGPIADGAFEVSARPTRTNRSTQHWNIELAQDGVVTTTATAVFGNRRDTWASTEIEAPPPPPADDVAAAGFPRLHRVGAQLRDAVRHRRAPHSRSGRTAGFDDHDVGARRPAASAGLSGTDIAVRRLLPARVPASGSVPARGHRLTHGVLPRRRDVARRAGRRRRPRHRPSAAVRKGLLRPVR
ncbi:hypothetical protein GS449_24190 [Rhodococcus hoagii]|nr:hypothetical protein [Prescottella equi]